MSSSIKIVTIGGGSTYTPELVQGLIRRYDELPISELWLVDLPEASDKLAVIGNLVKQMIATANVPIDVRLSTDRTEALPGADYVITQFRVGGIDSRIKDETIPARHHLLGQESIGIGGLFQALRTIPVMWDIIDDIKTYCDGAWLINVTNPTGIISEAIYRYAEYPNYVGISTITNYLANHFASQLGAKEKDIIPYFVGLYQLSYVISLYHKHRNSLQDILDNMDESELRFKHDGTPSWDGQFIKQLGAYPGPYLKYYYHYEEMLERYLKQAATNNTRAEQVKRIETDLLQTFADPDFELDENHNSDRGGTYYSDVACGVIASIHNDKRDYHVVITENNRAISDLPEGAAIEITCRMTKHGPVPVYIGTLPLQIKGLIQSMKAYEELLVDAIFEKDLNKAQFALQINPLIHSIQNAKAAFEELFEAHRDHLGYYEEDRS